MKKIITFGTSFLTGILMGSMLTRYVGIDQIVKRQREADKNQLYYALLNEWLSVKQKGVNLDRNLIKRGYKDVAIYGMGEMGLRLYNELWHSDVHVRYVIDMHADDIELEVPVICVDDTFEDVDAVVVTPIHLFEEIKSKISSKVKYPIISLEEVVFPDMVRI